MIGEPKQVQIAIIPNIFTAQRAGVYSNAESANGWNRVFFTNHYCMETFDKKPYRATFELPLSNIQLISIHYLKKTSLIFTKFY